MTDAVKSSPLGPIVGSVVGAVLIIIGTIFITASPFLP